VLFFRRLHPNKQPLLFARAARVLHEEGLRARFVVIGPDHGELDALMRFIAEHDAAAYLNYEGVTPISQSRERLAQADLFVQPTLSEPFGLSALQAMAEGVPSVVSTGFVIAPEIASAGGAMVVEPSLEPVTDAIRRLLDDPSERSALALRGHQMVLKQFSMDEVMDRLQGIYRDVCAPVAGSGP
jgi:glycosyltransferase involved in cell wall biosynthesis